MKTIQGFGTPTRNVRILVQALVFSLWVVLIFLTKHPINHWLTEFIPVSLFLRIDPLVMTAVLGGTRILVTLTLLGLVTLAVTLLLGRVFCGWVCPLGAIFDVYGWVLKKFRVPIDGPSPSWFRFKYYLLAAILILSIFGGVSPLMGFDPIVLLTRTAATVVAPFFREKQAFFSHIGAGPEFHGQVIDVFTLILFLAIMSATTRLSRIWCRTACPLGAYLAISSRNSVMRRQTDGCIHCNICSNNCPTGAISLKNPEVYNESECIKCFTCSQVCPVDANFFGLKSPVPAETPSQQPVSLGRRELISTAALTVVGSFGLNLSAGEPNSKKTLIRPPMSRDEHDFLSSCIRCGECMKACPTGILKPSGLENGLRALWSPVMVPTEGICKPGCNACSVACPTDAIMKYPIVEKYSYKAGTAVLNPSLCISHVDNKFCNECVRVCPTDAIKIEKGWEPPGGLGNEMPAPEGQKSTRPVSISFDLCIGCGACENSCDQIVLGSPAMVTTSFGRGVPSQVKKS